MISKLPIQFINKNHSIQTDSLDSIEQTPFFLQLPSPSHKASSQLKN